MEGNSCMGGSRPPQRSFSAPGEDAEGHDRLLECPYSRSDCRGVIQGSQRQVEGHGEATIKRRETKRFWLRRISASKEGDLHGLLMLREEGFVLWWLGAGRGCVSWN